MIGWDEQQRASGFGSQREEPCLRFKIVRQAQNLPEETEAAMGQ